MLAAVVLLLFSSTCAAPITSCDMLRSRLKSAADTGFWGGNGTLSILAQGYAQGGVCASLDLDRSAARTPYELYNDGFPFDACDQDYDGRTCATPLLDTLGGVLNSPKSPESTEMLTAWSRMVSREDTREVSTGGRGDVGGWRCRSHAGCVGAWQGRVSYPLMNSYPPPPPPTHIHTLTTLSVPLPPPPPGQQVSTPPAGVRRIQFMPVWSKELMCGTGVPWGSTVGVSPSAWNTLQLRRMSSPNQWGDGFWLEFLSCELGRHCQEAGWRGPCAL